MRPSRPWAGTTVAVAMAVAVVAGAAVAVVATRTAGSSPRAGAVADMTATDAGARASRSANRDPELVPPLRRLSTPDLWVRLPRPATPAQVAVFGNTAGLRALAVLDAGTVTLRGHRLSVVAGDVRALRGLTPAFTARSAELWSSVVRGEVTLSYATAGAFGHDLGATLPATTAAKQAVALRVGAFASLGLADAQAIVSRSLTQALGLRTARVVVLAAPGRDIPALTARVHAVFGGHAATTVLRPPVVRRPVVSAYARALIPAAYLALYQRAAATCRGLPWTVLAAIGTVESRNGADPRRSSAGAEGPMQFMPATWAAYGVDANGDGRADVHDPVDAVYSAARYLCSWGAALGGQALADAIWAYNHADWYVRQVLALAAALAR